MRISDQTRPVLMWTEATLVMLMLISSWLNHERLRRITALSVTSMEVGNRRFPRVQRLARKISDGITSRRKCHPVALEVKPMQPPALHLQNVTSAPGNRHRHTLGFGTWNLRPSK